VIVRDEPVAVDLSETRRETDPNIVPLPIRRRAADPIEAVRECHVIAHGDREIANLVFERTLEPREDPYSFSFLPLLPHGVAAAPGRMRRCSERN
jgi:hypothetical protein